MEYALSMQDLFLSAGLEAQKTRRLNLTVADCGPACRNLKEQGREGQEGILIEDSPWGCDGISRASTQKSRLPCAHCFLYEGGTWTIQQKLKLEL